MILRDFPNNWIPRADLNLYGKHLAQKKEICERVKTAYIIYREKENKSILFLKSMLAHL